VTIVLDEAFAAGLLAGELGREPVPLWGRAIDDGDVLRVASTDAAPGLEAIGQWVPPGAEAPAASAEGAATSTAEVAGVTLSLGCDGLLAWRRRQPEPVEICRLQTDLFSRQRGILESTLLADRTVLIVGLGSMGSLVARDMAMTGVGRFRLVDKDRLSVSNVSRHAAGLRDVGRRKTRVVAELVRDRNPRAEVEEVDADFASLGRRESERLLEGADLAICTADEKPARLKFAELGVRLGVAHIFSGCWERARAGLAFYWMPGWDGPCYACFLDGWESATRRRSGLVDYSSADDAFHLAAQPGLLVDIAFVTLVATKLALQLLCLGRVPPHQLDLVNPDRTLFLVGNRATTEFGGLPLEVRFAVTERRPGCPLCGSAAARAGDGEAPDHSGQREEVRGAQ
jgi:molybdopterin/thiamine biosynthesis adenylyltransferase